MNDNDPSPTDSWKPTDRNHYSDNTVRTLYRLAWGPSIHFGLYPDGTETIEAAAIKTKVAIALALKLTAADDVLEVGAGEGETARWLAREVGCHVTASNFTQEQIDSGRQKTTQDDLSDLVSHSWADFQDLPFGDSQFTAHLSQEAFVHCKDKNRYFSEAYRVLKPSGQLAVSDQTTDRRLCSEKLRRIITERHGSPDMWDTDEMINGARQAGFLDIETTDWSPHMARHFANLVNRIEANYNAFAEHVDKGVLDNNLELWRLAVETTEAGKIGWCLLTARKPE
ncbi:SAM-dependent methyltransferase [Aestuariispira ectoiniformans]|uniref:SAM-dependent methyltransferase n=1 Tax=Aestuariispira ectoiniformans TaxID=2775080 RepID=UPI00223B02ED|nr:class I SAM-dependent methyltransferase [Aestuariispira ectoiniformans]